MALNFNNFEKFNNNRIKRVSLEKYKARHILIYSRIVIIITI